MQQRFYYIKRLVRNIALDLRYGGRFLGGNIPTRFAQDGALPTENSEYIDLKYIFESKISVHPNDVLVDVGCGKGRVINWWLHKKFNNPIIGIEIDPDIAAFTKQRLSPYQNVKVICQNITSYVPPEGTLFYLYNPFNAQVLQSFVNQVNELSQKDKKIRRVIYYNCLQADVFKQEKWKLIDVFKAPSRLDVECAILTVNP